MARRRLHVALAASLTAALASTSPASAQEGAPSKGSVPSARDTNDILHLRDGRSYRGRLSEIVPPDHVTLIDESGDAKQVPWSEIDRIVPAGGQSPIVIAAKRPAPNTSVPAAATAPSGSVAPPAPTNPSSAPEPHLRWGPNRPLIVTGTIVFAAGYLPVAAVGVPSTAGLVGRAAVLFLTLGLGCLTGNSGYLCKGSHGAIELLIPVAGPILFAGRHPHDSIVNEDGRPLSDVSKALLYASAGLQTAGILTLLSGLVFGGPERVVPPAKTGSAPEHPSFFVAPLGGPGAVGISVGASRW